MDDHSAASQGLLDDHAEDLAPLEQLEKRILEMVDQLREARRKQAAADQEIGRLRSALAEKEKQLERLNAAQEQVESGKREVRSRIESLLDRLDSVEE